MPSVAMQCCQDTNTSLKLKRNIHLDQVIRTFATPSLINPSPHLEIFINSCLEYYPQIPGASTRLFERLQAAPHASSPRARNASIRPQDEAPTARLCASIHATLSDRSPLIRHRHRRTPHLIRSREQLRRGRINWRWLQTEQEQAVTP
jgi:hypothetical protein